MSSVIIKFDYDRIWRQTYGSSKDDGPVHRYLHRIVRQILRALDYATVLDVGCGMGHNLPLLAEGHSLRTYTGVDISTFALKQAQTLAPSGSFHYLDVQRVHLDGNWDLVYCSLILEHLPDDVAALEHMRAMTGRYLLATTIAADFERYKAWDERIGHVRNYQRGTRAEDGVGRVACPPVHILGLSVLHSRGPDAPEPFAGWNGQVQPGDPALGTDAPRTLLPEFRATGRPALRPGRDAVTCGTRSRGSRL